MKKTIVNLKDFVTQKRVTEEILGGYDGKGNIAEYSEKDAVVTITYDRIIDGHMDYCQGCQPEWICDGVSVHIERIIVSIPSDNQDEDDQEYDATELVDEEKVAKSIEFQLD